MIHALFENSAEIKMDDFEYSREEKFGEMKSALLYFSDWQCGQASSNFSCPRKLLDVLLLLINVGYEQLFFKMCQLWIRATKLIGRNNLFYFIFFVIYIILAIKGFDSYVEFHRHSRVMLALFVTIGKQIR